MHKNTVITPANCDITNEAGLLTLVQKTEPDAETFSVSEAANPALFQEVLSHLESGKPFGVRYTDAADHVIDEVIKDGEF